MLSHLSIKNYALIRNLEIEPSGNLNVITGETGAGKSIMLGALGLLLGNRADSKVLLNDKEKCITEGTFEIESYGLKKLFKEYDLDYSATTLVRREISPGGKSRAFINDTPVTLDVMKAIGSRLMDIHSQHETLELGKKTFQLHLIDTFAQNSKIKQEYDLAWSTFKEKQKIYESLTAEAQKLRQESDYIKFQLKELRELNIQHNEEEKLEQNVKMGEHAEEIKSKLTLIISNLKNADGSALQILSESRTTLNTILTYSKNYQTLFNRLESARLEIDDIVNELESEMDHVEYDPDQFQTFRDRLDAINGLLKKHSVLSTSDLLKIQEKLEEVALKTDNLDDDIKRAKKELDEGVTALNRTASQLSESRKKTFTLLSKQLVKLLQLLGIPQASIEISHDVVEPYPNGIDSIEINFSANKGITPKPLAEVASGGEFSRLMFSIKYIMAEKTSLPTLILDEIDSGVSGEIAVGLGKMMKEMAMNHQLITISHLPQIAAKADTHYMVYKDEKAAPPASLIKKLEPSGRVEEIAKMIGGAKPSAIALENARELIAS
jgi:DNA repair protein RecN (Recombination protein N)